MLNPTGLIRSHYECRSFDQTLPILSDLLALEVVGENSSEKILKHPNTDPTRPSNRCEIITARV